MTAPSIVNITVADVQAIYPQWVECYITWDQVIWDFYVENLIFESNQQAFITITGINAAENVPAPKAIYFGQTQVLLKDCWMADPYTTAFKFQVSPFMKGYLKISRQPWNKPLKLVARNAAGELGDWDRFLGSSAFLHVISTPYYGEIDFSASPSVAADDLLQGSPKIKLPWTCSDAPRPTWSGFQPKISDTTDFSEKPIVPWNNGNFWYWTASGCNTVMNTNPPYPWSYYGGTDPRTCTGPPFYLDGGWGGMGIDTTSLPYVNQFNPPTTARNQWGSLLANNLSPEYPYELYSACGIFGNSYATIGAGTNATVGRHEGWILANPENGNPLRDMPSTWTNQAPSSANGNCVAPWRLAKNSDPIPMLIQVYLEYVWIGSTAVGFPP